LLIDLLERTEALLGVCPAIGDPIRGIRIRISKRGVVNLAVSSAARDGECPDCHYGQ
jgi:hypothetical protein